MSKTPPKPGIYYGMPIDEYHGYSDVISKSGLDDISHSAAKFKAMRGPNAPARKEQPSQLIGNLAHCAFLEPAEFNKRYAVGPTVHRGTNVWKEFVASTKLTPIQVDQCDTAWAMAQAMNDLPNVFWDGERCLDMRHIMSNGRAEVSAFANDPNTGVLCRVRPDWVHDLGDGRVLLLDVKTVGSALEDGFLMQARKLRYYVQAKFYSDVYEWATGKTVAGFVFANVETAWPHAAASYQFGDQSMHEGWLRYRKDLDLYAHCLKTGTWPGIASQTTTVDLPLYEITEEEVEIPE